MLIFTVNETSKKIITILEQTHKLNKLLPYLDYAKCLPMFLQRFNQGTNVRFRHIADINFQRLEDNLSKIAGSVRDAQSLFPSRFRRSRPASGFGVGSAIRRKVLVSRWLNGSVLPWTTRSVRVT
jgi:hypothetical protein